MSYLKIPIDLKAAVSGKLERCSYEESIAQQIMLLIVSRYGEVIGKESYGSVMGTGFQSIGKNQRLGE